MPSEGVFSFVKQKLNKRSYLIALFLLLIIVVGLVVLSIINKRRTPEVNPGAYYQIQDQKFPIAKDEFDVYVLRCIIGKTKYKTYALTENLDITGVAECYYTPTSYIYVPLGFYDKSSQVLYYWTLNPIKNPTILDNLERRAEHRIASVFFNIEPSLENNIIEGQQLAVSYGSQTDKNSQLFNVSQIFNQLSFDKNKNNIEVDNFIKTGIAPDSKVIVPLSVDKGVYQIKQ